MTFLIISMITVFTACSDTGQTTTEDAGGSELAGKKFSGVTPCADCAGILYELTLDEGQSFESSMTYIGASLHPYEENGSWEVKDDTLLILNQEGNNSRALAIGDSTLTLLDADHNYNTGPLADYYVLTEKDEEQEGNQDRWAELKEHGVDFRASGNEPFWDVTIDFDGDMTFNRMDSDSMVVDLPEMEKDTSSKARNFSVETESGPLTVKLYPTGCVDDMSGEVFNYGVNVEYGDKVYRGCGNYINDKYQLNDFWTLHSLNGEEVQTDSLMKTPGLNFNLRKERVSGNSGCNQLTGGIDLQGQEISFDKLASTKMACQGTMEFETNFLKALDKVKNYEISQGELRLSSKDSVLMILRHAK